MPPSLEKILVGRKIYQGKLLPIESDVTGPQVIIVEQHLGQQYSGEIFQARFAIGGASPFFLKVPAAPLAETHIFIENETEKLEQLASAGNPSIPVVQKTFLASKETKLPFYLTNISIPTMLQFEQLEESKPIPHLDALKILYLLAKTLSDVEKCGVVHGGLDPITVQFYDAMPFITDWSTAKSLEEISNPSEDMKAKLYENPTWLPPEAFGVDNEGIFFDISKITPKTDCWALGILFMYLITGKKLFEENSPEFARMGRDVVEAVYTSFQKQNTSKYRSSCGSILQHMYLQNRFPEIERYFLDEVYEMLSVPRDYRPEVSFEIKKFNVEQMMGTRNQLLNQQKHFLIKEFYLETLLYVFDICNSISVKRRASATDLTKILELLYPGLPSKATMLKKKPHPPLFQDLRQTTRILKSRRFKPTQTMQMQQRPQQRPRSRPRHSMKAIDPNRVQKLVKQEINRYLPGNEEQ